jgi:hypothetical protein
MTNPTIALSTSPLPHRLTIPLSHVLTTSVLTSLLPHCSPPFITSMPNWPLSHSLTGPLLYALLLTFPFTSSPRYHNIFSAHSPPTSPLSTCPTASSSQCFTVPLLHCPTTSLSHWFTVPLSPQYPPASKSNCLTATVSNCRKHCPS